MGYVYTHIYMYTCIYIYIYKKLLCHFICKVLEHPGILVFVGDLEPVSLGYPGAVVL